MSVSRHGLTATVHALTDVSLSVISGTITLDDGWSPYIQVTLECWTPSETDLDLLDPRNQLFATLTATKEVTPWNSGSLTDQTRTFELLLRSRTINHKAGTMSVTLESKEALLQDFALVASDPDRVYGLSVKTAVEFAIAKVGATLEAGATDGTLEVSPPVSPTVTNLIPTPTFRSGLGNWIRGGGGSSTLSRQTGLSPSPVPGVTTFARVTWTTAGSASGIYSRGEINTPYINVTAGLQYTIGVWVRVNVANSMRLSVQWNGGAPVTYGATKALAANVWTRITETVTAPPGATRAGIFCYDTGGGFAIGYTFDSLGWVMVEGSTVPEFFDGATADTSFDEYAWTGTADLSTSTRTNLPNNEAMIWKPGTTAWDYLEPLLQVTGLRLYCDDAGAWRLERSGTLREGQINVSTEINLTDAQDTISRSEEWFDSVVIAYTGEVVDGIETTVYDIAGAPGTKTLSIEYARPYPGSGGAQALLDRAEGRGRVLRLESIADLTASPGMSISATLPDAPIQTGTISSVSLTLPAGTMSIGSRGLADTPAAAWLLAPVGLAWEDVAVGIDWTEYTP